MEIYEANLDSGYIVKGRDGRDYFIEFIPGEFGECGVTMVIPSRGVVAEVSNL